MDFLWFALGIAVSVIPLSLAILFTRRNERADAFDSENISQLIGRIQHVTSVNVDTLEKKVLELKKALRDANTVYMKLNEIVSDAKNVSISVESKASKSVKQHFEPYVEERGARDEKRKNTDDQREEGKIEVPEKHTKRSKEDSQGVLKVKTLSKEEKIFELVKRGWSIKKIAESLNIGVGEVSLIVEIGSYLYKINGKEGDK